MTVAEKVRERVQESYGAAVREGGSCCGDVVEEEKERKLLADIQANANLTIESSRFDHTDRRRIRSNDSSLIVRNSNFVSIFPPGQQPTSTRPIRKSIGSLNK